MSVYLDVNALVPLFVADLLTERAEKALGGLRDDLIVSNFSTAEFSAVIARRVRTRDLRADEATAAFLNFDAWCSRHTQRAELEGGDIAGATGLMRRFDLSLRTPDALHIAMVQRLGCRLLSFDRGMTKVARTLGVALAKG